MNVRRIYLDYNATSPLSQSVLDWLKSGDLLFANPSSQHSSGKAARKVINETRLKIHQIFNRPETNSKLFFHSGATEAVRTWAHSFSEMARLQGKELLICYSKVDHPAVTNLETQYFGPHVKFLLLKRDKNLHYLHDENLKLIKDKKENNPELIILYHHLWVHNETGAISPLEALQSFKELSDLYIHVDAVQAPGKIAQWANLSVGDIWTFSAHKFGALKGLGFTLSQKDLPFYPLISGGGQQQNMRSGTENLQGIKSLSLALDDLLSISPENNSKQRAKLENFMQAELKGVGEILSLGLGDRASNTIYFYLNDLSSDIALALFDLHGLEISAGSACASGAAKPSTILLESGHQDKAKNGLRLSMGFQVTDLELSIIQEAFHKVIEKIKAK